jgi:SAM-dependent methyltransferase
MLEGARQWRADLAAWQIPEPIVRAAGRSPWVLPREVFVRRARSQATAPTGVSFDRAVEAVTPRGEVLDVGAGAGAASLPLAPWASAITAVDSDEGMLAALGELAYDMGVPVRTTPGRWPEVSAQVEPADVVLCHHVLYNVPDLEPFVAALTAHARRRVVVELSARHPLVVLNPLWRRFHGLDRPEGPAATDAVAVLRELGLDPRVQAWRRPVPPEHASYREMVETTHRRLCLPPERIGEVDIALRELGVDPRGALYLGSSTRELVTVWWAGTA